MPSFIVFAVIVLLVVAVAIYAVRQKNRESNIARAEELRTQAATEARTTLPPAQDRAAEAEAKAEEARAAAERARAEAEEARVAAAQAEAEHEAQVRAADRLDPRVDHKSDDYAPQVAGTVDQQPTPPSDVDHETPDHETPEPESTERESQATGTDTDAEPDTRATDTTGTPLLPRRNPGTHEMPGKPMEGEGPSGGWFTRKDS